ncbi:MAG TPA: sulfite exporter TauE/SafE family protein [Stellaceae bacterium]|nr:sulfite exporter TauE/SafE family protein [Stellaceae bacterium]
MLSVLILFIAGFAGGVLIAIAGGGSFVTFPALLFAGVPAVAANASSTVALLPGNLSSAWAYRHDLLDISEINVKAFAATGLVGALCGAMLLLVLPGSIFARLVPWLMLFATIVFAVGNFAPLGVLQRLRIGNRAALVILFLIAVYGGFFGGGLGFLMLAALTLFGMRDIHAMNSVKLVLTLLMTVTAVATFVTANVVYWTEAMPMLVGSLFGGHLGVRVAKQVDQHLLKAIIAALGAGLTFYFFWRGA